MKKLIFEVVLVEGEKIFKLNGNKKVLFLNRLSAMWFEGYRHSTECEILRAGNIYDSADVRYCGGHDSGEYFYGFNVISDKDRSVEILSESLEVGDIIQIENDTDSNHARYKSADAFIDYIDIYRSFSQSMDKALNAHNGRLSGDEFLNALVSATQDTGLSNKKVLVIRF